MSSVETLKDIAILNQSLMDEAYGIFKSKTFEKFLFVEGKDDKKILSNRGFNEDNYYYLGMIGKKAVTESHYLYWNDINYSKINKIAFIIDNDYDHITSSINISRNLFIHSICPLTTKHSYNDLEGYLIDSLALDRFLYEYELSREQISQLRKDIELESRRIGKYRAANEFLKKEKGLPITSSILVSFEIDDYIDKKNFLFNERGFQTLLKHSSPYKNFINELCLHADRINDAYSDLWTLSRGHDVSELLSIYLFENFKINLSAKEIEQYLRLSIDSTDFSTYSVFNSLNDFFK